MKQVTVISLGLAFFTMTTACGPSAIQHPPAAQGIAVYEENPHYWSYKGVPVLLLGGTVDDNLFQIDSLRQHLELLRTVGGNYVRCTMSSRDSGNVKAWMQDEDGLYDLEKPNPVYWSRLNELLSIAAGLDIIVQIEIWATYDFYWGDYGWAQNPFNPALNRNYTAESSGLPAMIDHPAQTRANPFFHSIPELSDLPLVLKHQKDFVDRLLEVALPYDNVLYCIDNETLVHYAWGKYWSEYLRTRAGESGREILITEMWDSWDPSHGEVSGAINQHPALGGWFAEHSNPELHETARFAFSLNDTVSYQFLDVSNNNAQHGQTHYNTALWVRRAVEATGKIRPVNNVKIYGAVEDQIWSGTRREGQERFWRNIFAGHASARFHRPPYGIGLDDDARPQILSMRMLSDSLDFFTHRPAPELLSDHGENEAFCLAGAQNEFAIYFPDGGSVTLQAPSGSYIIRFLDIASSGWTGDVTSDLPGRIDAPNHGPWACMVRKR